MLLFRNIIQVFFILAFSFASIAGNTGHTIIFDGKELKLSSDDEKIFLGERKQGSNISMQIKIRNESSDIFQISNVRGSCGLSIPSWPRNPIKPGEEQNIQIRYDASNPGLYTKILTIHSNTQNSRTIIPVVAEIVP
jgi:hypothetical protein